MAAVTWAQVRWDILDTDLNTVGTVTPSDSGRLSWSEGVRTIRGLSLYPDDTAAVDVYDHYLQPVWQQTDTTGTVETSLGVFCVVSGTNPWVEYQGPSGTTVGRFADYDLCDLSAILDVPLEQSVGFPQGTTVTTAIVALLELRGFTVHAIAASTTGLVEPATYDAGKDTTWQACSDLAESAGMRFFFDRDGIPTATFVPSPLDVEPDYVWDTDGAILDKPVYTSNPFAPNRFERVGGTDTAPIVGVYNLPSDAPNSYANRGFVRLDRDDVAALSQTDADMAAQAAALDSLFSESTVTFTIVPEPELDGFVAFETDGVTYILTDYDLRLSGDAVMEVSGGQVP